MNMIKANRNYKHFCETDRETTERSKDEQKAAAFIMQKSEGIVLVFEF